MHAVNVEIFGKACTDMFGPRKRLPALPGSKQRPWGYDVPTGDPWQAKIDTRLGIQNSALTGPTKTTPPVAPATTVPPATAAKTAPSGAAVKTTPLARDVKPEPHAAPSTAPLCFDPAKFPKRPLPPGGIDRLGEGISDYFGQ